MSQVFLNVFVMFSYFVTSFCIPLLHRDKFKFSGQGFGEEKENFRNPIPVIISLFLRFWEIKYRFSPFGVLAVFFLPYGEEKG